MTQIVKAPACTRTKSVKRPLVKILPVKIEPVKPPSAMLESPALQVPKHAAIRPNDDWDDRRLLRQAQQDRNAFATLYRRHVKGVYRFLMVRVGNVEDAQDLTTQTFMAALDGIRNYREEGTVASWFLGIARNKSLEHLRRSRPHQPLETALELTDQRPLPDQTAQIQLDVERVIQMFNTIAAERAEALSLRYFSELSNAEVAEVMGKSEDAVKMLIHRGLRDLRARLATQPVSTEGADHDA